MVLHPSRRCRRRGVARAATRHARPAIAVAAAAAARAPGTAAADPAMAAHPASRVPTTAATVATDAAHPRARMPAASIHAAPAVARPSRSPRTGSSARVTGPAHTRVWIVVAVGTAATFAGADAGRAVIAVGAAPMARTPALRAAVVRGARAAVRRGLTCVGIFGASAAV
jgi:hypothetical protein